VFARTALVGLFLYGLLAGPAAAQLPEPVPQVPDKELFTVPLNGNLGSPFGQRWGRMHEGIDIEGWAHTRVYAAMPGEVMKVGWLANASGFGLVVKIRHERGIVTMYAHLAKALVHRGERVARGQLIGRAGCTGSCTGVHLHFQVWVGGKLTNPLRFLGNRVRLRP
jgi:murein DD-endopeptidase MepM/ murein hydrolase activator NlpD